MLEITKHIPQPNWYVGLLFEEGYWFVQLIRQQQLTNFMPYTFNSDAVIAPGGTSGWETPTDANGRNYLEPQEEETIYQFFTGVGPTDAQLYLQYTQRVDRMNLITPRPVPGQIGYWNGQTSRYNDPSPQTALWTVNDIWPHFNASNPTDTNLDNESHIVVASFWLTPYTYKPVSDKTKILQFLKKDKPSTIVTMGDGDRPIKAPSWLLSNYQKWMVCPEDLEA